MEQHYCVISVKGVASLLLSRYNIEHLPKAFFIQNKNHPLYVNLCAKKKAP